MAVIVLQLGTFDPLLRAVQRLAQPRLVHGFEEVIDGVQFECAYGVLLECRHERDQRDFVLLQRADDAEAVELGHVQIEQRQVRLLAHDQRHRLSSRRRLAHDDGVVERSQHRRQKGTRWPLVVRDDDPERRRHVPLRSGTGGVTGSGTGIETSTTVAPLVCVRTARRAAGP